MTLHYLSPSQQNRPTSNGGHPRPQVNARPVDILCTDGILTVVDWERLNVGEKRKRVYAALVDGATEGLSGDPLYSYVKERCPKVTSKKLVRAALLALSDNDITDRNILDTIYALAIKHRLDPVDPDAMYDEEDEAYDEAPSLEALKRDISELAAALDGASSANLKSA